MQWISAVLLIRQLPVQIVGRQPRKKRRFVTPRWNNRGRELLPMPLYGRSSRRRAMRRYCIDIIVRRLYNIHAFFSLSHSKHINTQNTAEKRGEGMCPQSGVR